MYRVLIFLNIIIYFLFNISYAIDLSLKDAINLAIKNSEEIQIKQNETSKLEHQYYEAKGATYPQINSDIKWSHYFNSPKIETKFPMFIPQFDSQGRLIGGNMSEIDASRKVKQDYELSAGISVTQVVWAFGKISHAIELAKNALEASLYAQKSSKKEVIFNTKILYLSALMARESFKIAKESYENAKKNKNLLNIRFASGRPSRGEILKMNADIASRLPSLKQAESDYISAIQSMQIILNLQNSDVRLTDSFVEVFPTYKLEDLRNHLLIHDPAIKALEETIKLNQHLVAIKKASFYPTIAVFGTYQYGGDGDKPLVGKDKFQNLSVVGLSLQMPIFNGGITYHQYQQSSIDKTNNELKLQQLKEGLELDLQKTFTEYVYLKEVYQANINSLKLAEQSFKITQDRFKYGRASTMELNDAELMLTRSKLQVIMSLYKINTLIAKIEKLSSQ